VVLVQKTKSSLDSPEGQLEVCRNDGS
jgi:hypothetical protein